MGKNWPMAVVSFGGRGSDNHQIPGRDYHSMGSFVTIGPRKQQRSSNKILALPHEINASISRICQYTDVTQTSRDMLR